MEKKDLSSLSKEELIKLLLNISKENENLLVENKDLLAKKYALEQENFKLHQALNKLLKKLQRQQDINDINAINRFMTTSEHKKAPNIINEAEATVSKAKKGRKKGGKNFTTNLEPLVEETIVLDYNDQLCPDCNSTLIPIGEDSTIKLEYVPGRFKAVKYIRKKYKCPKCEGKIFQLPSPHIYFHSFCTPSLAANIINTKFTLAVPLDRYAKHLNSMGIMLSKVDLSNYVLSTDRILKPLYDALLSNLVNQSNVVIFADETPLQVQDYSKINRKNGYVFVYVSSYYANPIYIYSFSQTRTTDETEKLLKNFKGYLVCDGYSGYNKVAKENIKIHRCWSHIRREFFNIVKTLPENLKKTSVAVDMVNKIDVIFHKEKMFQERNYNAYQIHEARHTEEYQDSLNSIYETLHNINAEEGTTLDKAVKYFLNLEEESKTFLLDGHIPLTNNISERAVKPFVIARKNFLFAKSELGAEASARLFSIIQTARANGLITEKYIDYVISNIDKTEIENLLPWSKSLPDLVKQNLKF